jgi:hypothetical protein
MHPKWGQVNTPAASKTYEPWKERNAEATPGRGPGHARRESDGLRKAFWKVGLAAQRF